MLDDANDAHKVLFQSAKALVKYLLFECFAIKFVRVLLENGKEYRKSVQ